MVSPSTSADIVFVLTTLGADADAVAFGRRLVEERLAACVNVIGPLRSIYRWHGTVAEDGEQQLVIKTTRAVVASLEARVAELHPYALPEFLIVEPSGGSAAYLAWVRESVG